MEKSKKRFNFKSDLRQKYESYDKSQRSKTQNLPLNKLPSQISHQKTLNRKQQQVSDEKREDKSRIERRNE